MRGYRTPYEANKHQDAGAMAIGHVKAVILSNFMSDLAGANRTSLALREHEDPSKVSGAGSHLFHTAVLAFVTACMQLSALLDRVVEGRLDLGSMHTQYGVDQLPSWKLSTLLSISEASRGAKSTAKLPKVAELGLPKVTVRSTTTDDKEAGIHPTDGTPAWEPASENMPTAHNAGSRDLSSIVATADLVAEMIYDLCTHTFAALDVREHSSQILYNSNCSRLGVWLRLADDTLLKALTHRLEAEAVFDLKEMRHHGPLTRTLECSKCKSEHCGGYCTRLQIISFNITKLEALRRSFDRIASPGREGIYFISTYQWLKDALEYERQIAANAAMPPTRQGTPLMSAMDMTRAMATPAMDDAQTAAAMPAIRLNAPAEEVAWHLQDVHDRHDPRPPATNGVPLPPVPLSATTPAEQDHSAPSSSTGRGVNARFGSLSNDPASVPSTSEFRQQFPYMPRLLATPQAETQSTPTSSQAVEAQVPAENMAVPGQEIAMAFESGDNGAEQSDGSSSAYVPHSQGVASSSGVRTRPQLRRSSRVTPVTPEP